MLTSVVSPILNSPGKPLSPLARDMAEYHVYELCRVFAGIEIQYSSPAHTHAHTPTSPAYTPDFLLPCYSTLYTGAFCCPPSLRTWLWSKLSHLEILCPTSVVPIRGILARLWKMPGLVRGGFGMWKGEENLPPMYGGRGEEGWGAEDIEIATSTGRVEEVGLGDGEDGEEDGEEEG